MVKNKSIYLASAVFAGAILLATSVFVVDERQHAIVMQFGEAKKAITTPGLVFKIPFVQDVVWYDRRLLSYDVPFIEVTAADNKRITITLLTRYVIEDPITFYKRLGTPERAKERLAQIVPGAMRRVIGQIKLSDLFSEHRQEIMTRIHENVREAATRFGVDVRDVRIIAADFPAENQEAIFRRMQTQQVQLATLYRAQGANRAQEIQAIADRTNKEIRVNAEKDALVMRGEADAEATVIYAKAHNLNVAFYERWRSLKACRTALKKKTKFLISSKSKFLQYLN